MSAAVGGSVLSTKIKMAFSGGIEMRLRITYTNCPTCASRWSSVARSGWDGQRVWPGLGQIGAMEATSGANGGGQWHREVHRDKILALVHRRDVGARLLLTDDWDAVGVPALMRQG